MGQSIFNINKTYEDLISIIEDNEGEISEEVSKQLDITIDDVQDKFRNYALFIRKLQGECKIIDDEVERLSTLKRVKSNIIKNLEKIVLMFLPKFGTKTKAGQGFKYVFDMGNIKLENKYTKPLELSEEFINIISKIVELEINWKQDDINKILSDEDLKILVENLNKYTELSYTIEVHDVESIRVIFDILADKGITLDTNKLNIKINNSIIKEDLKNGIIVPGAIINEEYAKLTIK